MERVSIAQAAKELGIAPQKQCRSEVTLALFSGIV